VIVHAATHTSLEDRLSAHVLYFCLSDIAAEHCCGGGVRQLLVRHIGQLAKDLNLMLRRRRGPAQGLHTLLRWGMKKTKFAKPMRQWCGSGSGGSVITVIGLLLCTCGGNSIAPSRRMMETLLMDEGAFSSPSSS
jgi:hypothetical protein